MIKSTRYKNNNLLPRAGLNRPYTEHEIRELEKCIADPVYFAKTYFQIVHVDLGLIPFELFEYQEELIRLSEVNRNVIICAARQSGKTSAVTVIILHAALFNSEKLIAILANKGATAREILHRIKKAYELLPEFLKPGVREWNKGSVEFENGSKIIAEASSSDNIRGKTVFLLYIDELAFVEQWDDFSASVLPTISSGQTTKMIFSSTPHGLNHFYDYVQGARKKTNDFGLIEVPWQKVPGRDEKWKESEIAKLGGDILRFQQEHELEFIGSSGTLINGSTLKTLTEGDIIGQDQFSRQYFAPIKSNSHTTPPTKAHSYALIADVSRGKGLDYSTFSVIDITTIPYVQVFTYRNNTITPTDFALVIDKIGRLYNNAAVLVENNDLGAQVLDMLFDYEYENLIYTVNNGKNGKVANMMSGERGIRTTFPVKNSGCNTLKLLVEQKKLLLNDKWTIKELNTFSAKGKSYEAEPGNHDDMVMGLVLFAWLSFQQFFKDLTDSDILSALREKSEDQLYEEMLIFGFDDHSGQIEDDENPNDVVVPLPSWLA